MTGAAACARTAFTRLPCIISNSIWAHASVTLPPAERRRALARLRVSSRALHLGSWFDRELVGLMEAH